MGILLVFKQQSFQDLRTELKIKLKVGMRGVLRQKARTSGLLLMETSDEGVLASRIKSYDFSRGCTEPAY